MPENEITPDAPRSWILRKIDLYAWPTAQVIFFLSLFLWISSYEIITLYAVLPIYAFTGIAFYLWDRHNDYYVLETHLKGDVVGEDPETAKDIESKSTGAIFWSVPDIFFKEYKHDGANHSFWDMGGHFVFSDMVHRKLGIIFHGKYFKYDNISFFTLKNWFINSMKKKLPEMIEKVQTYETLLNVIGLLEGKKQLKIITMAEGFLKSSDGIQKSKNYLKERYGGTIGKNDEDGNATG